MAIEDNGALDADPSDYEQEHAQWLEYNDGCMTGLYKRQHALPVNRNAESGIIYDQTYDVCVIPLYRIEE